MSIAVLYYRLVKFEHTIFALPFTASRPGTTCSGSRLR
jgi:hypothetical protein